MLTAALAFAGAAAVINITPGLDTLLVLRTSVSHGRTAGLMTGLGVLVGCLAWGLAAAVGLTALLTASHLAYDTLRIAGAGYLTWLGIAALRRSRRGRGAPAPAGSGTVPEEAAPRRGLAAFRAGLGTNLLNPKAGVFYMSLIPQFIPHEAPVFGATLLFTAIDAVELAVWFLLVSGTASALGERLRRPSFHRRTEQVSGVVFLGFAVNLLAEPRAASPRT